MSQNLCCDTVYFQGFADMLWHWEGLVHPRATSALHHNCRSIEGYQEDTQWRRAACSWSKRLPWSAGGPLITDEYK